MTRPTTRSNPMGRTGARHSAWPRSGFWRHVSNVAYLAGGLAFLDLEDEVSCGREGKVWAVAEDGVARTGKLHQAGGLRR
jgi:hypothetical protein